MRTAGLLVFLVVCGLGAGCKNKGEADAAPDPTKLKEQQDLIARRDKLLQTRQQLQTDRDKMDIEIKDIEAKGGDASEQKKKLSDLDTQLSKTSAQEITEVNSKLDAIKQTGDKSAAVAAREADIASRERALADREARVADREKSLIQRDSDLAQRWKDSCATGSTMIIQQPATKSGGNYTKKDVGDLIARAKSGMSKKGILTADLPGPAQVLESEAGKALNDNDMSKAYFAAAQLSGTIDSIAINRPFIQAKMARVQAQIKSSKPDDATNQQLSAILSDVIQKFGDGEFGKANAKLNQLIGMLK